MTESLAVNLAVMVGWESLARFLHGQLSPTYLLAALAASLASLILTWMITQVVRVALRIN